MSTESLRSVLWRPVTVLVGILIGLFLRYALGLEEIAHWVWIISIFIGASAFLYSTIPDIFHARLFSRCRHCIDADNR